MIKKSLMTIALLASSGAMTNCADEKEKSIQQEINITHRLIEEVVPARKEIKIKEEKGASSILVGIHENQQYYIKRTDLDGDGKIDEYRFFEDKELTQPAIVPKEFAEKIKQESENQEAALERIKQLQEFKDLESTIKENIDTLNNWYIESRLSGDNTVGYDDGKSVCVLRYNHNVPGSTVVAHTNLNKKDLIDFRLHLIPAIANYERKIMDICAAYEMLKKINSGVIKGPVKYFPSEDETKTKWELQLLKGNGVNSYVESKEEDMKAFPHFGKAYSVRLKTRTETDFEQHEATIKEILTTLNEEFTKNMNEMKKTIKFTYQTIEKRNNKNIESE